jgi:hypothetical protein
MAVALGAAACGSNSSTPTAPTPAPAAIVFTQQILPANETQGISGGEQTGSGTATITFNVTQDSTGTLTSATASFNVSLTGFPATTNITIAHIHIGVAGSAPGSIVVNTGLASGDVTLANGAGSFQKTNIAVDPTLAQQIINNPAGYYFNVHSTANPVGVARGQLVRTQ